MKIKNKVITPASVVMLAAAWALGISSASGDEEHDSNDHLLLSDEHTPWQDLGKDFIKRPKPFTEALENLMFDQNRKRNLLLDHRDATGIEPDEEIPERKNIFGGSPFLGRGEIDKGFETPTGAIWQPVFLLYGTYRTALQVFDGGRGGSTSEWANRLDLFGNLYLTPTERILIGVRPFDNNGNFSGYEFNGPGKRRGYEELNFRISTFYFEGDFGELFPNLDPDDEKNLDYGFAIGRQPMNFQGGILVNDVIDAVGISRASLFVLGSSATRATVYFGFNDIHRNSNRDSNANLYGFSMASDYDKSTFEFDAVYVDGNNSDGGDGLHIGFGHTRRYGHWNSTARVNVSRALNGESAAVSSGTLVTHELSRTVPWNEDIVYLNTFYGDDDYASAARDPSTGGPLGPMGILYASAGLGSYGAPLGNRVGDTVGFALGYQHFLNGKYSKKQVIVELAGRTGTDNDEASSLGLGFRYQQAMGRHAILQFEGFAAHYDDATRVDDTGYGIRSEFIWKF